MSTAIEDIETIGETIKVIKKNFERVQNGTASEAWILLISMQLADLDYYLGLCKKIHDAETKEPELESLGECISCQDPVYSKEYTKEFCSQHCVDAHFQFTE